MMSGNQQQPPIDDVITELLNKITEPDVPRLIGHAARVIDTVLIKYYDTYIYI